MDQYRAFLEKVAEVASISDLIPDEDEVGACCSDSGKSQRPFHGFG